MKAKIIAYTERGTFESKVDEPSEVELAQLKDALKSLAENGTVMNFDTARGTVFIAGELLKTAVFEIVLL